MGHGIFLFSMKEKGKGVVDCLNDSLLQLNPPIKMTLLHEPNGRVGSRPSVPLRVFVLLAAESKSLTTYFIFVQQSCRASLESPDRKLINKYVVAVIYNRVHSCFRVSCFAPCRGTF